MEFAKNERIVEEEKTKRCIIESNAIKERLEYERQNLQLQLDLEQLKRGA